MISVIIPFYNHVIYVEVAYRNLLKQTLSDWELIYVNNNSSDGSVQKAKEIVDIDPRVRIVHEKKQGIAAARNAGLRVALGEYITFLDVDDEFIKTKFDDLLKQFDKYPDIGMAYGLTQRVYKPEMRSVIQDKGIVKEGWNEVGALAADWISLFYRLPQTGSTLVKTSVARDIGGFDEHMVLGNDDVGYHLKIAFNYAIAFLNKETVIYYRHSESEGAKLNSAISVQLRYFDAYYNIAMPLAKDYSKKTGAKEPLKIAVYQAYINLIEVIYASNNRKEKYIELWKKYQFQFIWRYDILAKLSNVLPKHVMDFINRVLNRLY